MAAGVPTTGIGGLFYILQAIAIGVCKTLTKIRSHLQRGGTREKAYTLTRFPTIAFILSSILIVYMNATGFRFTIPGSHAATFPSYTWMYLGLIGIIVVGFFTFILVMFQLRANTGVPLRTRPSIIKIIIGIVIASATILPLFDLIARHPLPSITLISVHLVMIVGSLKLMKVI
jgi:hypothetical protein